MKKALAIVLTTFCLGGTVFAAAGDQTVTASRTGDVHITYQDIEQKFTDANGGEVLPIIYEGTTYLPVRAVSSIAGLSVEWNQETQTVILTSGGSESAYNGAPNAGAENVSVTLSGSIGVTLDGQAQIFTDVNGKTVLPMTYNGTTYLPVRAVCGLTNTPVEWDQTTSTVKLDPQAQQSQQQQAQEQAQQQAQSTGNFTYPPNSTTVGLPPCDIAKGYYVRTDKGNKIYNQAGEYQGYSTGRSKEGHLVTGDEADKADEITYGGTSGEEMADTSNFGS